MALLAQLEGQQGRGDGDDGPDGIGEDIAVESRATRGEDILGLNESECGLEEIRSPRNTSCPAPTSMTSQAHQRLPQ